MTILSIYIPIILIAGYCQLQRITTTTTTTAVTLLKKLVIRNPMFEAAMEAPPTHAPAWVACWHLRNKDLAEAP